MIKFIKNNIIGFILGVILTSSTIGVIAYSYQADDIEYTTNKNNQVHNVEQAINDLYTKVNNCQYPVNQVVFSETYVTNEPYTWTVPCDGKYKIELWGASGGTANNATNYGKGSYTSGTIDLSKDSEFYVYIGQQGLTCSNTVSYNGGGAGVSCGEGSSNSVGGGATDIRTVSGLWNDAASLRSRIMVAAGGSGKTSHYDASVCDVTEVNGGGLKGYNQVCNSKSTAVATQTSGNAFGVGGNGQIYTMGQTYGGGSASGGWYGGLQGIRQYKYPYSTTGGSGSSYISGHKGCVGVTSAEITDPKVGCLTETTDITCSYSPTNYIFDENSTIMIDGSGYSWSNTRQSQQQMPKPVSGSYTLGVGHTGNGYAKITYVGV